jgi:hypothetical protein
MKRLIVLALACAVVPLASAEMYKYIDKNGKTVYSDTPPADADAKPVHVTPSTGTAVRQGPSLEKDLEKGRALAKERSKKEETAEQNAKLAQQRCEQAKEAYHAYEDGGRLFKYNDKGEREFLSDEEIDAKRVSSRRDMEEACGKS